MAAAEAEAATTTQTSKWLTVTLTLAVVTISASSAISVHFWRRKSRDLYEKMLELEKSLKTALEGCAAERRGRIRAQKELRTTLVKSKSDELEKTSYPMAPIGHIQSCFSTRNGTPRQPLVVPLARARLRFDSARVPPASLEGLEEYSHCWIIYIFHLNTDLDKLWKHPSRSKFNAKVRVPRLNGEKKGVFATRSPHRPCAIGLTVAKVLAVHASTILLSGVDLVDGTPVLDVKPYLPYCDSIHGAIGSSHLGSCNVFNQEIDYLLRKYPLVTESQEDNLLAVASVSFSKGFFTTLADCWATTGKKSLYASADEFQSLIRQVLSWDIRSLSQRTQPHNSSLDSENAQTVDNSLNLYDSQGDEGSVNGIGRGSHHSGDILYHLTLEGLDVAYRINTDSNVLVEKVTLNLSSK